MKKILFAVFVFAIVRCSNGPGAAAPKAPPSIRWGWVEGAVDSVAVDSVAAGAGRGAVNSAAGAGRGAVGSAAGTAGADTGWAFVPFTKVDSINPVLGPGSGTFVDPLRRALVKWEEKDVFNPAIAVRNGKLYMLYRAQDKVGRPAGTSRIGLAVSEDGYHFARRPAPVLYPAADAQKQLEWEGGCEDPRVVQDQRGIYYMTYTAFDGRTARLMVATSTDLVRWIKHGSAFADANNGRYSRTWSKSGSIVSHYLGGKDCGGEDQRKILDVLGRPVYLGGHVG